MHRGNRVTPADDGCSFDVSGDGFAYLRRPVGKRFHFKDTHGAVPNDGSRLLYFLDKQIDGARPDIESHLAGGYWLSGRNGGNLSFRFDLARNHVIDRQEEAKTGTITHNFGGFEGFTREVDFVLFNQRLPNFESLGAQEGISHAAANEQSIDFLKQILNYANLIADFRSAQNGNERPRRILQHFAQILELLFHKQPRRALFHEAGHTNRGSMSAMCGAESVVHINISQRS